VAIGNDALGYDASPGDGNTAVGDGALYATNTGSANSYNTAVGFEALVSNTTGIQNTALGAFALSSSTTAGANTTGQNTALGAYALALDQTGGSNTAVGAGALYSNTANSNTAVGLQALNSNTSGSQNDAVGEFSLRFNTVGINNDAMGTGALYHNTSGSSNVALGISAGYNQTTGSSNVYIGAGMAGIAGESNACYIASIFGQTSASGVPVLINSNGKLGTTTSSKRFKEAIKPMDSASETIFALKPVSFRYKKEIDPARTPQLGLVAEEVEKVNPALVIHDKEGKPYTVRYDQVNAMLLNEFLKEHKAFVEEQRRVQRLEEANARREKRIKALASAVNKQGRQIDKVTAQIELGRSVPQIATNH
jgi:hypothetical protein